jgi:hypothetical protein
MKKVRLWLGVLVAMTFLSGASLVLIGVRLSSGVGPNPGSPQPEQLREALGLSEAQYTGYRGLQAEYQLRLDRMDAELKETLRARTQVIVDEFERKLLESFTPEQRQKYHDLSVPKGAGK